MDSLFCRWGCQTQQQHQCHCWFYHISGDEPKPEGALMDMSVQIMLDPVDPWWCSCLQQIQQFLNTHTSSLQKPMLVVFRFLALRRLSIFLALPRPHFLELQPFFSFCSLIRFCETSLSVGSLCPKSRNFSVALSSPASASPGGKNCFTNLKVADKKVCIFVLWKVSFASKQGRLNLFWWRGGEMQCSLFSAQKLDQKKRNKNLNNYTQNGRGEDIWVFVELLRKIAHRNSF